MSETNLNRADGCSVFFSLLIGLFLVSAYFLFQMFFDIEEDSNATQMITNQRIEKVAEYKENSRIFTDKIDLFHAENNSSIESQMLKTTKSYNPKVVTTK